MRQIPKKMLSPHLKPSTNTPRNNDKDKKTLENPVEVKESRYIHRIDTFGERDSGESEERNNPIRTVGNRNEIRTIRSRNNSPTPQNNTTSCTTPSSNRDPPECIRNLTPPRMKCYEPVKNMRRSTQFSTKPLSPPSFSPKLSQQTTPRKLIGGPITLTRKEFTKGREKIAPWNGSTKLHNKMIIPESTLESSSLLTTTSSTNEQLTSPKVEVVQKTACDNEAVNVIQNECDKYDDIIDTLRRKGTNVRAQITIMTNDDSDTDSQTHSHSRVTTGKLLLAQQNTPQFGRNKQHKKPYFH